MKKVIMYIANDIRLIAVIYVVSLLAAAELFSLYEGKEFLDSLYWTCVTSLTVGYGDIAPVTAGGRITMAFFGHFWTFGTLPLIVANIILKVIDDRNEFSHDEQEELKRHIRFIVENIKEKLNHPSSCACGV